MKSAKNTKKMDLWTKTFLYDKIFYQILMLYKFLKIYYVPFEACHVISKETG